MSERTEEPASPVFIFWQQIMTTEERPVCFAEVRGHEPLFFWWHDRREEENALPWNGMSERTEEPARAPIP